MGNHVRPECQGITHEKQVDHASADDTYGNSGMHLPFTSEAEHEVTR